MIKSQLKLSTKIRLITLIFTMSVYSFSHYSFYAPCIEIFSLFLIFFNISHTVLKFTLPFFGVLLIGSINIFEHDLYDIYRDISFALYPMALILIGFWIAEDKATWPMILKTIVFFGFIKAIVHLSSFVNNFDILSASAMEIRSFAGTTSDSVSIAFALGFFKLRERVIYPKFLPRLIVMPILLASIVLSYSRTEYIVAIILCLSLMGWLSRINKGLLFSTFLAVGFYSYLLSVTPTTETGTFRSKIVEGANEVKILDYQTMEDINANWRGYESYLAIASFSSDNIPQKLFGKGFGSLVDLGFYMPLGNDGLNPVEVRYIPILHNGFVYILFKTGLVGLLFYIFFYLTMIRHAYILSKTINYDQLFMSYLLMGVILSMVVTTYVVGGLAEVSCSEFMLLLSFIMAYKKHFPRVPT